MADLVQNKKILIGELKNVLKEQSLYSVNSFLDYCGTLRNWMIVINTPYIWIYCYSWCLNNTL